MQANLYGVRGSLPSGITAEAVEKKIDNALHLFFEQGYSASNDIPRFLDNLPFFRKGTYGSTTMCIEVCNEHGSILFDSGSGIRPYGLKYQSKFDEFHIFQTHMHWDHTCGLPFFIPAYMPNKQIHFYSPHEHLEKGIKDLFQAPYFPVPYEVLPSKHHFHQVKMYEPIPLFGLEITPFQLDHPNHAFGYHVQEGDKRLVICFDAEFKRMSRKDLGEDLKYYQDADIILFDGQYTVSEVLRKIDWGHCTAHVGVDLCLRENIGRLVIVHHDPESSDERLFEIEQTVAQYYHKEYLELKKDNPDQGSVEIVWGYEGLTIDV